MNNLLQTFLKEIRIIFKQEMRWQVRKNIRKQIKKLSKKTKNRRK